MQITSIKRNPARHGLYTDALRFYAYHNLFHDIYLALVFERLQISPETGMCCNDSGNIYSLSLTAPVPASLRNKEKENQCSAFVGQIFVHS